jgi:hypothetical protein
MQTNRREFLAACAATALWPLAGRSEDALPVSLLEQSDFVYISPLLASGKESTSHGEVWYGWLDGAVVINTAPNTWKSRALAKGHDRARIWVGNHGRWKGMLGHNEDFRTAPHFDAQVASVKGDDALLDALLALYEKKYPAEIANWRDKMRDGYHSGERLLLRYTPA